MTQHKVQIMHEGGTFTEIWGTRDEANKRMEAIMSRLHDDNPNSVEMAKVFLRVEWSEGTISQIGHIRLRSIHRVLIEQSEAAEPAK